MIAAWMLYTLAVTTLLFAGASAAEYIARALRLPARFVWAAAMLFALGLSARTLARPAEPTREAAVPGPVSTRPLNRGSTVSDAQRAYERWSHLRPAVRVQSSVKGETRTPSIFHRAVRGLDLARLDVARLERWNAALIALCVAASGLAFLWLVGSLVTLQRIERELTLEVVDDDVVLVSGDVGPALFGIIRSRIVLPRWVLSLPQPERHIILAHEHQHAAAFDPALLYAAAVALALQPWNVALWALFARLRFALETDCDRRVLEATGDARGYGRLLVTVYERTTPRRMAHVAFVERPSDLERRIRRMTRRPRLLSIAGATAALTALLLTTAAWTLSAPVRSAVSRTLIVQPPVWRLPTVTITGRGVAPRRTMPAASITPSSETVRAVVQSAPTPSISFVPEGPCKKRSPRAPYESLRIHGDFSTTEPACTIDGDVVMLALDSSHVLVAWRDTSEADVQDIEYLVFTTEPGSVPSNLTWSAKAGHAEFRGSTFYFASPSRGVPGAVFVTATGASGNIDPAALRFVIHNLEILRRPSIPWDVLRQLPTAPRCTVPLIIIDGVVSNDARAAQADQARGCFVVGGQEIRVLR